MKKIRINAEIMKFATLEIEVQNDKIIIDWTD